MSFLLDTNVLSDLRKAPRHTAELSAWFDAQASASLFLSVISLGEIRQGIEQVRRRDSTRANRLAHWLDDLTHSYSDRLLSVDATVADEWGRLRAVRSLPVVDALLAATARVHGMTLVTRNERDFTGLNVDVLNPHRAAPPRRVTPPGG